MTDQLTGTPLWVRWRAASLAAGWPDADASWRSSEVLSVADAITDGRGQLDACLELGRQRAAAGLSLAETRADLRVGVDVAVTARPLESALVDALTDGWVDQAFADVLGADWFDPLTQLASAQYLVVRLGDIYGLEARCSRSASETYALTVVRCVDSVPFPHRDARLAVLNGLIRAVLMPDDTPARLGPNTAAALVRRRTGLPTTLRMLRAELDRRQTAGHLPATQMWLEALPSDISDLPNLLRQFRR